MKRIVSLALCIVVFALCFSGCRDNSNNYATTEKRDVLIELKTLKAAVQKGEIIGVDVKLGDNIAELKKKFTVLSTTNSVNPTGDITPTLYDIYKGKTLTCLTFGANQYFYLNDNEKAGVAVIACAETAYNFNAGNCYSDDIIHSLGAPTVMDIPDEKDLFYLFGTPDKVTRLTYIFDSKRLDFILVDDNLCMTVLTDTNVYKNMGNGTPITKSASEATSSKATVTAS